MRSDARRLLNLGAVVAVLAIWMVLFRPQSLGGGAMYIVVRGNSMQPTYQTGDLVFVESAPTTPSATSSPTACRPARSARAT